MCGLKILEKALQIINEGEKRGLTIRLLGGLAFAYLTKGNQLGLERSYNDIDLIGIRSQASKLTAFLVELGLVPNKIFNTIHGYDRLQFFYGQTKVDVFLDEFKMSHYLNLKDRLKLSKVTIPVSDLLLTKLQIQEITEKDMLDIVSLLANFRFSNTDSSSTIDAGYIAGLLSKDWGFYKTATDNLKKVARYLDSFRINEEAKEGIRKEIEYLLASIETKPKSAAWKLRAKIGERVRWYALPEEVNALVPQYEEMSYMWIGLDEVDRLARKVAKKVLRNYGTPGGIVYIERGGMIFGSLLAKYLKVKELAGLQVVSYKKPGERKRAKLLPFNLEINPNSGYVLLVDDIVDTGETMKMVFGMLSKRYKLVTATIAYKPRSVFKPDVYGVEVNNNTWLVFGYEEKEVLEGMRGEAKFAIPKTRNKKEYERIKEECERFASRLKMRNVKPDAIIYLVDSTPFEARILSDYLDVRRVIGIKGSEGLRLQLEKLDKKINSALIVARDSQSKQLEQSVREVWPGIRLEKAVFNS